MPGIWDTQPVVGEPVHPRPVRVGDGTPEVDDDINTAIPAPPAGSARVIQPDGTITVLSAAALAGPNLNAFRVPVCELRNTDAPHNKFYQIKIVASLADSGTFDVIAFAGLIGTRRPRQYIKRQGVTASRAVMSANRLMRSKAREGYVFFNGVMEFSLSDLLPLRQAAPAPAVLTPLPPAPPRCTLTVTPEDDAAAMELALPQTFVVTEFFQSEQFPTEQVRELIDDEDVVFQVSRSSDRIMLRKEGNEIIAYSGRMRVACPTAVKNEARIMPFGKFELDGYFVEGRFEAIDVIDVNGQSMHRRKLLDRLEELLTKGLTNGGKSAAIRLAPIACSAFAKATMAQEATDKNRTVYARRTTSIYTAPAKHVKCGRRCAF